MIPTTKEDRRRMLGYLLCDPDKRRELFARTIVSAAVIDGREVSLQQAYRAYDTVRTEKTQESKDDVETN